MEKNKVYLIRHAESEYNLAQGEARKKNPNNEEDMEVKFNAEFCDCKITQKGFEQVLFHYILFNFYISVKKVRLN